MALIKNALIALEDDDQRVTAVNLQSLELNDTWAALLSTTLEVNRTVRFVNLNRCEISADVYICF